MTIVRCRIRDFVTFRNEIDFYCDLTWQKIKIRNVDIKVSNECKNSSMYVDIVYNDMNLRHNLYIVLFLYFYKTSRAKYKSLFLRVLNCY